MHRNYGGTSHAEWAVDARGLVKAYGPNRAVNGVDLKVKTGTIYGVLGPNGAGKSTCFQCINGQLRPDSGRVEFDGTDVTGLGVATRARMGMARTFQIAQVAVSLTVRQHVALALAAQEQLAAAGIPVRVVSMPCTSVFDAQDAAWRESVLPKGLPRVAVEAGCTAYWYKYVGLDGAVVGIDRYGESAPAGDLFKHFGLTAEAVAAAVQRVL